MSEKQQAQMRAICLPPERPSPPDAARRTGEAGSCGQTDRGRSRLELEGRARGCFLSRRQRALPQGAGLQGGGAAGTQARLTPRAAPLRGGARAAGSLTWQTRSPACSPGGQGCCRGRGSQLGSRKQWLRTGASWPEPQHLCLLNRKGSAPPKETHTGRPAAAGSEGGRQESPCPFHL